MHVKKNKNIKVTKFNKQQSDYSLNEKAKRAGYSLAKRGGMLPSDAKLENKYNFNIRLIETFKKAYQTHYQTPEEQGIRRAITAARECIWKGRDPISDENLTKKYKPDEVLAYKEAFLANYITKAEQIRRKEKNQLRVKKYLLKKKTINKNILSSIPEEPKQSFIKAFIARAEEDIQKSAKEYEQMLNSTEEYNNEVDTQSTSDNLNVESETYLNLQEKNTLIPSPFDLLNQNHTPKINENKYERSLPLLFQYSFEAESSTTQLGNAYDHTLEGFFDIFSGINDEYSSNRVSW